MYLRTAIVLFCIALAMGCNGNLMGLIGLGASSTQAEEAPANDQRPSFLVVVVHPSVEIRVDRQDYNTWLYTFPNNPDRPFLCQGTHHLWADVYHHLAEGDEQPMAPAYWRDSMHQQVLRLHPPEGLGTGNIVRVVPRCDHGN